MELFKLKNKKRWHITSEEGNFSLCYNAKKLQPVFVKGALTEYEVKRGTEVQEFTGEEDLCPSCVLRAYKDGLINVVEKDQTNEHE